MYYNPYFEAKTYYGYEDPLFLANFDIERRAIVEQAIAEYHKEVGKQVLRITDEAEPYGYKAIVDPTCNALRFIEDRTDLSKFWEIYRRIKA